MGGFVHRRVLAKMPVIQRAVRCGCSGNVRRDPPEKIATIELIPTPRYDAVLLQQPSRSVAVPFASSMAGHGTCLLPWPCCPSAGVRSFLAANFAGNKQTKRINRSRRIASEGL